MKSLISKISNIPEHSLSIEMKFSDIPGWDSFMWLEFGLSLEEYGFTTLFDEIDSITTIKDAWERVGKIG